MNRRGWAFWVALFAALTLCCAPALGATGAIDGKVTDASSKKEVPGAKVCEVETSTLIERCVETLANGSWEIAGLAAGGYKVAFSDGPLHYAPQWWEGASSAAAAKEVNVASGETVSGVNAALHRAFVSGDGGISGTVANSALGVIEGIEVCAWHAEPEFGEEEGGEEPDCTTSGSFGQYALADLPPGEYEVEFSSPPESSLNFVRQFYDEVPSPFHDQLVHVHAAEMTESINARMHEGGRISGAVRTVSGAPVGEAGVCAIRVGAGISGCVGAEPNGAYSLGALEAGSYYVLFLTGPAYVDQYYEDAPTEETARTVTVTVGKTDSEVNARLHYAAQVDGTVTLAQSGAAMEEVQVCAFEASGEPYNCAWTGPDGGYRLGGLPAGTWRIGFNAGLGYYVQYWNDQPKLALANPLALIEGEVRGGIDASIRKPGEPVPTPAPIVPPASNVLPFSVVKPVPVVKAGGSLAIRGGRAFVKVSCATAACAGTVRLTARVKVHTQHGSRLTTVTLGKGSYTLAAGKSRTIVLHLTPEGRRRIAAGRRHPFAGTIALSVVGGSAAHRLVVVR